ncbi:hypothetical protein [Noviherbaspirillum sp. Root189]|uniref:hypothetical protein n=1 Tax=Noviherbaspirillum sp. Root189 TaxID=1736487 RepID=UPI00070D5CC0|nr:hypothetical protein [Noviherbaspirillum sp. Root189]KRB73476.1 hypothetical protein ASE07_06385 [Noviherbaspirillum sp. Root189]
MKMAKADEKDIDAAGELMGILDTISRGHYPAKEDEPDIQMWFDQDDPEHLRRFYEMVSATLDKSPGYPGRVIGGMCYVILYDKNEIVDPNADVIELHPKLQAALQDAERLDAMENLTPDQCMAIIKDAAKNRTLRAAIDTAMKGEAT